SNDLQNLNNDPFAEEGANVLTTSGENQPIISHDTETKFGDYNSTKVVFNDYVQGSNDSNAIYLRSGMLPLTLKPNEMVMVSFLIKANKKESVRFISSGTIQTVLKDIEVDTKWRRFVFIGRNYQDVKRDVNFIL